MPTVIPVLTKPKSGSISAVVAWALVVLLTTALVVSVAARFPHYFVLPDMNLAVNSSSLAYGAP